LEATAAPKATSPPQPAWATKLAKLADGAPISIDWTSSNLNRAWFGGSSWIPEGEACNGAAWRKVIIDGLNQASVAAC
jgi:hypothetical protein